MTVTLRERENMESSTFLVHCTRRGAELVSEFESRHAALAEAERKIEGYLLRHLRQGDLAAARATLRGKRALTHSAPHQNDVTAKIAHNVSFTITTRAVVPGQNRIAKRLLWNRQPRAASIE